jgi:Domain of unknown function (DUF397)
MDSIQWRKSSYSGNNGACVEVARLDENTIGVRDSKEPGVGPILAFSTLAWRSFIFALKEGSIR